MKCLNFVILTILTTFSGMIYSIAKHAAVYRHKQTGHVVGLLGELHAEATNSLEQLSTQLLLPYLDMIFQQEQVKFILEGDIFSMQECTKTFCTLNNQQKRTSLLNYHPLLDALSLISPDMDTITNKQVSDSLGFNTTKISADLHDYRRLSANYLVMVMAYFNSYSYQFFDRLNYELKISAQENFQGLLRILEKTSWWNKIKIFNTFDEQCNYENFAKIIDKTYQKITTLELHDFTIAELLEELTYLKRLIKVNIEQSVTDESVITWLTIHEKIEQSIQHIFHFFSNHSLTLEKALKSLTIPQLLEFFDIKNEHKDSFYNFIITELADFGFLYEITKSALQNKHAFLFCGAQHSSNIASYLTQLGYTEVISFNVPDNTLDSLTKEQCNLFFNNYLTLIDKNL